MQRALLISAGSFFVGALGFSAYHHTRFIDSTFRLLLGIWG